MRGLLGSLGVHLFLCSETIQMKLECERKRKFSFEPLTAVACLATSWCNYQQPGGGSLWLNGSTTHLGASSAAPVRRKTG